jgi:type IV pilus assembly protein PilQ
MRITFLLAAFGLLVGSQVSGQTSPQERRSFRDYTSPDELVSIAPSTSFDKAISALSEVSKKFIGKVIVDTEHRSLAINIDIQAMHWRDALELICQKNGLWYTEYENYIEVISIAPGGDGSAAGDKTKNRPTFGSREIKISAVFFEVNLSRLEEIGVNWNFMKAEPDYTLDLSFDGADQVSSDIFEAGVTPQISFANMDFLARLFSSQSLGEILSGPQIVVRSGEEGKIQVGQDFSIKERDFAGNLIDRFYHAGTIINVTPTVLTEQGVNFVHMDVRVERSSVLPSPISTIVDKSEATTKLMLLDGEETVIGGLYSNETTNVRTGIPLLKDLPPWFFGLRYLFGYDKDQVTKKELVILLKAELIPTLQERITQKTTGDRVYERWLQEQQAREQRVRGGMSK